MKRVPSLQATSPFICEGIYSSLVYQSTPTSCHSFEGVIQFVYFDIPALLLTDGFEEWSNEW